MAGSNHRGDASNLGEAPTGGKGQSSCGWFRRSASDVRLAPTCRREGALMNQERSGVLELAWVLDAPRERIFSMLTEPAEVARWWGPQGFRTVVTELEPGVGGGYRFAMQPLDG